MGIERRSLSGRNPRLTIDLSEMFGQRVPDSEAFKQGVGQAIIDRIRDRTNRSLDRQGNRFKNYSKQYAQALEFKAGGKSISKPNLRLTGDMLGFMDITTSSRNTITIGWDDVDEQLKAHGHILGSSPGPRVRRDFLGLPEKDYEEIADRFVLADLEPEREAGILATLTTLRELFSDGES